MRAAKVHTEVRQDQIAQAALDVVAAEGVRGLSVAAVARRVGIVPSGIYRHYKGKDAVLDAAIDLIRDRLLENVRAVGEPTTDPVERLRLLLLRHAQLVESNHGIPRIVFSTEVYHGHRLRRERVYRMVAAYLDEVADIVRQGQGQGSIRAELDPAGVAMMFLGMVQPAAFLWQLSGGAFRVVEHATAAWEVFRRAIEVDGRQATGHGVG